MADNHHDGGMIALVPDDPGRFALPGGPAAEEIHCTLCYLGPDVTGLPDELREALLTVVGEIATGAKPIDTRVMGQAAWNADGGPDGDMDPVGVYQLEAVEPLLEVQRYVDNRARDAMGALYPAQHAPYLPHITVADGPVVPPQLRDSSIRLATIRLAWGDQTQDFPLTAMGDSGPVADYDDHGGMAMATKTAKVRANQVDAAPQVQGRDEHGQLDVTWPVLAVEGLKTSDKRGIRAGGLTHRTLPVSVLAQMRNPGADGGHAGAEVIGHLHALERVPGPEVVSRKTGEPFPEGTWVWRGQGKVDPETAGGRAVELGHLRGNSLDLSEVDYEESFADDGSEGPIVEVTQGRIAATTLCPIPAFEDAYVEVGGEAAEPMAAAALVAAGWDLTPWPAFRAVELGDECGPCGAEEFAPDVTKRKRAYARGLAMKGAKADGSDAKYPIENQSDLDKAVRMRGQGDADTTAVTAHIRKVARKLKLKVPDSLTAAGAPLPPLAMFTDPQLSEPTPLTVRNTPVGREIRGHIATWDQCHISIAGRCRKPPRSRSDYAYFNTGAVHCLDELGAEQVAAVGHITMDTGHPSLTASVTEVLRHYDHTGTVAADVAAGEDDHGIWVHGLLRPALSDDQVRALVAAAPSGDWRPIAGSAELVACLVVNTPGFPVPRARVIAGQPVALVAAGAVRGGGTTTDDDLKTAVLDALTQFFDPDDDGDIDRPLDTAAGPGGDGDLVSAALAEFAAGELDVMPPFSDGPPALTDFQERERAELDISSDGYRLLYAAFGDWNGHLADQIGPFGRGKNWVAKAGGLPSYVKRIVKHLREKGMIESRAIATAINVVKKMCANAADRLNFPGRQSKVNPGSIAQACAALARWEAMKAKAHATGGK